MKQAGFTLIEVLLATTLLSVMMLLLTGSLRIGVDSWESGERRLANASRMFVVENFLRQHISRLLPIAASLKDGDMEPSFVGSAERLAYVAPMPDQIDVGGLYRFELYLSKKNGSDQELRMSITPFSTAPDQNRHAEPVDDLSILDAVESVHLSYLAPPESEGGGANMRQSQSSHSPGQWSDDWKEFQPPALIRIEIKPAGEEPWPTLLIAPRTRMVR